MANSYSVNPIRIDTAFGTASTTAGQGWKFQVKNSLGSPITLRVLKLYWESPVTVADTVSIIDPISSINLANFVCDTAAVSQTLDFSPHPLVWSDFMVPTISSGILWIYTI